MCHGWCSFHQTCVPTFFTFSQNSEINLTEIGPYIDYLREKQGVNSIFGKFKSRLFVTVCYHLNHLACLNLLVCRSQ